MRWGVAVWLAAAARGASAGTYPADASFAGLEYDGHGALSAGASSRLLIDYPEPVSYTHLTLPTKA